MTQKDFELIASGISQATSNIKNSYSNPNNLSDVEFEAYEEVTLTIKEVVKVLGYKLLLNNPKFDQCKFEKACGLEF